MIRSEVGPPRGILRQGEGERRFTLVRVAPSADVAEHIAHYWQVAWDLEAPYVQETLPHPSVHVVIEPRRAEVVGVMRGKFSRRLAGRARVFGVKFRPAAYYPLAGAALVDVRRSLDAPAFARAIRAEADPHRAARLADDFWRARVQPLPPRIALARDLVERVAADPSLVRVEQAAALAGCDVRALQRLLKRYVGVTPKWLLQRFRLHEAAALLSAGEASLAELALRLGYFDQSHFIRDFKAVVGAPPGAHGFQALARVSKSS